MNRWLAPGCLAAVMLIALGQAGGQTHPAGKSNPGAKWGTPDGGAVVINPGGKTYSILCDDVTDKSSVSSEGRVMSLNGPINGEHTYKLKPTTPGQQGWTFEVIAKPDGTGELWVSKGKARHLVASLKM